MQRAEKCKFVQNKHYWHEWMIWNSHRTGSAFFIWYILRFIIIVKTIKEFLGKIKYKKWVREFICLWSQEVMLCPWIILLPQLRSFFFLHVHCKGYAGQQASGLDLGCCLRRQLPGSYLPAGNSAASSAAAQGIETGYSGWNLIYL